MAITLSNEAAQEELYEQIKQLSEKYKLSQNITSAILQFEFVRQSPLRDVSTENRSKMDAIIDFVKEAKYSVKTGGGMPLVEALAYPPNTGKSDYTFYCTYMVVFKKPVRYEKEMRLEDSFLICSNDRGLQYYYIGKRDEKEISENNSGIKMLDTVCGCNDNLCSLPECFNISGTVVKIEEEDFPDRLLHQKMNNIEKIYADIKMEIIPKYITNVFKTDNNHLSGSPLVEDIGYIG